MKVVAALALAAAALAVAAPLHGEGGSPTYADVAPILQDKCAGCHVQGGIAPFALTSVRDAQVHADAILRMTQLGAMPPWPPSSDSQPLAGQEKRLLTADEKDLIARWVAAGAPAGAPVPAPPQPSAPRGLTLSPRGTYTPRAAVGGIDDYHCFLLEPKLRRDVFVTGARVIPGQPSIVHHVILFEESGAAAAMARAKDRASRGKGWTCFGGPNLGELTGGAAGVSDTLDHSHWLGVWVPGKALNDFPAGTGMRLPRKSVIVLQIHYNLIHPPKPDRTRAVLTTTPATAPLRPLETMLLPAPVELPCPDGASGALCDRNAAIRQEAKAYGTQASYIPFGLLYLCGKQLSDYPQQVGDGASISTSCDRTVTRPLTIYAVAGHMHLRGVDISVQLNPGTPKAATLLHIPAWNFHWQDVYTLKTPVAAAPGDVVRVSCRFDNSVAHQPLVGTRRLAARYVLWGEGTTDEMCLGVLDVGDGIAANAVQAAPRALSYAEPTRHQLVCSPPGRRH
ncbi:MAG TPA: hypothetical protein VGJ25_03510 [Gaiellaceae bacterium]